MIKFNGRKITPNMAAKVAVAEFGNRTLDMSIDEYIYIYDEDTKLTDRERIDFGYAVLKHVTRVEKFLGYWKIYNDE